MGGMIRTDKGGAVKRVVWAVVAAIVVIGTVGLWQPWDAATARQERMIDVRVAIGIGSAPFGFVEVDGPRPFRQLIITDATGAIVGAVDLQVGTIVDGDCVIESAVTTTETAFYTFVIDEKYRHTISSEALGSQGWHYDVWLGVSV